MVSLTLSLASLVVLNANRILFRKSPEHMDDILVSADVENSEKDQTSEKAAESKRF